MVSFLATSRLRRRALSDNLSSLVLTSQLSSPPTCSTERSPCVETRSLTLVSSASDISVTFCKLGRKVRLVLLLARSEEHTSELQSLMRTSYAVFCLKKKKNTYTLPDTPHANRNQSIETYNTSSAQHNPPTNEVVTI